MHHGGSITIGAYEIACLCDGVLGVSTDKIIHKQGELAKAATLAQWGERAFCIDANCYLLTSRDGYVLIDAGGGPMLDPSCGQIRAALRNRGVRPDDIRTVLLTHLHDDQVYGLFDEGRAFFPNAEVLVSEVEYAFFTNPLALRITPEANGSGFKVAERLTSIYNARIRSFSDSEVMKGVKARLLPGHTPGHPGYHFQGEEEDLLVCGDILHLGAIQASGPDVGLVYDIDFAQAAETRRAVLEEACSRKLIIAGGHIGFTRVEKLGHVFNLSAVD